MLLVALLVPLAGCSRAPATLASTFDSDEAVARAVLDALAHKDADRLAGLALTKDEFESVVWPTLPVSRPEVRMPMDYLWQDTFTKSRLYLAQTLEEFGGRRYSLVRVEFQGDTTDHESYSVSRKTRLVVTDASGAEQTIRVFGSIIRQAGRSKVYSYIVD